MPIVNRNEHTKHEFREIFLSNLRYVYCDSNTRRFSTGENKAPRWVYAV